jgi:ribosomal-protein-serine acetyltransferase
MFTLKVDHEIELQLLQIQDSTELFQLVQRNRSHLRKWLPWVDSMVSSLQYQTIIPEWLKQYANNNGFHAGIRFKGKLAGVIGLHFIDWYNKQTTIGYYLGKEFEGYGIMTRTVKALLHYIFSHLFLNRVEIRCGVFNDKSRAIPERLGFVMEGVIRDGEFLHDHFHDLAVYGLLARQWADRSLNNY